MTRLIPICPCTAAPARRRVLRALVGLAGSGSAAGALGLGSLGLLAATPAQARHDGSLRQRGVAAAQAMRQRSLLAGDLDMGAVVIYAGEVVGEGPSRTRSLGEPVGHAHQVAIADAQRRLGRSYLGGALLFASMRPCRPCEQVAAQVGVVRMFWGEHGQDGGEPRRQG